jgi:cold shock CspA family protein
MVRHKDYRVPKRRYDYDDTPEDRVAGGRPNGPKPSAPQAWQSVDAVVKWFNPEKGFGFVAVDGGFDAFLHVRFLGAPGYNSLPAGARVKVQIGRGQKGPQVSAVIEVDISTVDVGSTTAVIFQPRRSSRRQSGDGQIEEGVGSLLGTISRRGSASSSPTAVARTYSSTLSSPSRHSRHRVGRTTRWFIRLTGRTLHAEPASRRPLDPGFFDDGAPPLDL